MNESNLFLDIRIEKWRHFFIASDSVAKTHRRMNEKKKLSFDRRNEKKVAILWAKLSQRLSTKKVFFSVAFLYCFPLQFHFALLVTHSPLPFSNFIVVLHFVGRYLIHDAIASFIFPFIIFYVFSIRQISFEKCVTISGHDEITFSLQLPFRCAARNRKWNLHFSQLNSPIGQRMCVTTRRWSQCDLTTKWQKCSLKSTKTEWIFALNNSMHLFSCRIYRHGRRYFIAAILKEKEKKRKYFLRFRNQVPCTWCNLTLFFLRLSQVWMTWASLISLSSPFGIRWNPF